MSIANRIKVLVIDDSALIRKVLTEILSADTGIEVVGSAADPFIAREQIKKLQPDVLTLDIEMPKMDGITFLENLMRLRPMPVVMISTLTEKGAEVTLNALKLGAVDYITKPKVDISHGLGEYAEHIISTVKLAAQANLRPAQHIVPVQPPANRPTDAAKNRDRIIAVGASTGGTEAIHEVLQAMPAGGPAILITQHIPKAFSGSFADRLNRSCAMTVSEASDGEEIKQGHAYVAPGDQHLRVERQKNTYICRLDDGPAVNRHKPSVDVLFDSMATTINSNAIGVLLTGMGQDGAHGLKRMLEAGGKTIAQDKFTSVIWGMPGEAVKLSAAQHVLPLEKIAESALNLVYA